MKVPTTLDGLAEIKPLSEIVLEARCLIEHPACWIKDREHDDERTWMAEEIARRYGLAVRAVERAMKRQPDGFCAYGAIVESVGLAVGVDYYHRNFDDPASRRVRHLAARILAERFDPTVEALTDHLLDVDDTKSYTEGWESLIDYNDSNGETPAHHARIKSVFEEVYFDLLDQEAEDRRAARRAVA